MGLYIYPPGGGSFYMIYNYPGGETTIKQLREIIKEQNKLPADQIDLFYNGVLLEDDKTLNYYGIQKSASLSFKYKETEPEIIPSTQISELNESSEAITFSNTLENKAISSSSLSEETQAQKVPQSQAQTQAQTETLTQMAKKSSYVYIDTTVAQENNLEETLLVLFGFSHYKLEGNEISLYIYFVSVKNFLFSQTMNFHVIIDSASNLRLLQNTLAFCDKVSNDNIKVKYLCKFKIANTNIKRIECLEDFSFSQKKVKVISLTPNARKYINNLQNIEDIDLFAYNIYILNNAINNIYDINLFNISGIIENEKPNFGFIDLVLIMNSRRENETEAEANCKITEISGINYTLSCETEENVDCDLQSAVSYINNNDMLLINFDNYTNNYTNSSLITEAEENIPTRYFMTNSGLSNTAMFLIIFFALLFPIIIVIAFLFIIRKKLNQKQNSGKKIEVNSVDKSLNNIS